MKMSFFEIGAFLIGLSALFGFLNHKYLFQLVGLEVLVIAPITSASHCC